MYEHKTRSDGCIEQVSVGYLLAQKGLAKCADYAEHVRTEESDNDDPENCESDGNVLEFQESELSFKSAASEARTESKSSSSADLLEKIFDSKVGFASSSSPKTPLLTPSAMSSRGEQQSSKKKEMSTELSSSVKSKKNESSLQITTIRHVTKHVTKNIHLVNLWLSSRRRKLEQRLQVRTLRK